MPTFSPPEPASYIVMLRAGSLFPIKIRNSSKKKKNHIKLIIYIIHVFLKFLFADIIHILLFPIKYSYVPSISKHLFQKVIA